MHGSRVTAPILRRLGLRTSQAITLIACLCGSDFAHAAESSTSAAISPQVLDLLQEADSSIAAGNLDLALIQLKKAVAQAPRNGEVRAPLGLALLRAGNVVIAIREFRQALTDGGPEDVILPALLEAMLVRGQMKELLAEFGEPPQEGQSPVAADILIARAKALQMLGQAREANASMDRALTLSRDSRALVARANLAAQQNDLVLARRLAEEAAKFAPDSNDVLMLKVGLLRKDADPERALAEMDAFLRRSPKDLTAKALRVEVLLDLKREMEAEREVDDLLRQSPHFTLGIYYRALIAARTGNAKTAWRIAQTLQPEFVLLQPSIAMPVAQMAIAGGNPETGKAILSALLSRHPESTQARMPLGRILLSQGNAEGTLTTLEPLRSSREPQVQALLAQAYLHLRRYGDAIGSLDAATTAGTIGGQDLLKQQLALSSLEYGDAERAVKELQELAAQSPRNWGFVAPLMTALVTAGRLDEALSVSERMARADAKSPLPAFYRGQILALKGNLAEASRSLGQALAIDPKFHPALYYRARIATARGDSEAARVDFRKILDQDAANTRAYLGLAQLAFDEDKEAELLDLLAKAAKAAPGDPAPRLALANYRFAQGKYVEAQAIVTALLQERRNDPEALALQGQVYFALGEKNRAIETFRSLAAGNPQSAPAYVLLAKALNSVKDRLAAIDAAKTAVLLAPFSAPVHAVLAEVQIVAERPGDALNTVQAFRTAHPGVLADLLFSNTLVRLKRLDEAYSLLDRSHLAKPDRLFALRLSQIAVSQETPNRGIAVLGAWLESNPTDFDVRKQRASLLLQTGDLRAAQKEFETLLKQRPEDPTVLNNLAWALQDENRPLALQYASLAAKVTPRSATALDTLGWLKYRAGDDKQGALAVIQRAYALNASDGQIAYHYALCLEAAGQRAEAKALLQKLVEKDVRFNEASSAKQLLASW